MNLGADHVIARSMRDAKLREQFKENPAGTLREAGAEIPEGVSVHVHQDTAEVTHAIIPHGDEVARADVLRHAAQAPAGHEVKILENSPDTVHYKLPRMAAHPMTAASGPLGQVADQAMKQAATTFYFTMTMTMTITVTVTMTVTTTSIS